MTFYESKGVKSPRLKIYNSLAEFEIFLYYVCTVKTKTPVEYKAEYLGNAIICSFKYWHNQLCYNTIKKIRTRSTDYNHIKLLECDMHVLLFTTH